MSDTLAGVSWRRFWIPREMHPVLDADGYFADPKAIYGERINPNARTLDDLDDRACIALLGEPGIGKSRVVQDYQDSVKLRAPSRTVLYVDFRWQRDLDRAIFNSTAFQRWLAGDAPLWLILDSLDEHPAGTHEVAARLIGELQGGLTRSLRLRIACRNAEWPGVLDEQLPRLWKDDADTQVGFYALAPLRRSDVTAAAGEDAANFLSEVNRTSAQPLAIKPITLQFLLTEYRRHQKLPRTRLDLYERGCKILCEESSRSLQGAGRTGALRGEQRLALASRIAAVCVLGRCSLVNLGSDRGALPPDAVDLEELAGGIEPVPSGELIVDVAELKEVLKSTGLFAPRGVDCVGWAHQTYAEFLAARFLRERQIPPAQALRELTSATTRHVVPALNETAAWLASMDSNFFQSLLAADPAPLLGSDFAMVGPMERAALVEALLRKISQRDLDGRSILYRREMQRRLDHAGLADQLRPYVADRDRHLMARHVAIDIAWGCNLVALQDILADVALSPGDDSEIRSAAAQAVAKMGSVDTKRRLKPLIFGACGPDPKDDLKGYALQALWPDELTADELFSNLTPPKNESHGGAYSEFLYKVVETLSLGTLARALRWTVGLSTRDYGLPYSFEGLLEKVILLGWENIGDGRVCTPFADAVWHRLRTDGRIFGRHGLREDDNEPSLTNDDPRRRLLTTTLVASRPISREDAPAYVYNGLILPHDTPWAIDQLRNTDSPVHRSHWANILDCLARRCWTFEVLDPIIGALHDLPELREAMPYLMVKVDIGSPESRWMRREYRRAVKESRRHRRHFRQPQRKRLSVRGVRRNIRKCLERFWGGDIDAGWMLQLWMLVKPESGGHFNDFQPNLDESAGWQGADEVTRAQILETGRSFLLQADEGAAQWLGRDIIHRPAYAGYRYLCLLEKLDPVWLNQHSTVVCGRWTATILDFATNSDHEQNSRLVARAYRAAPERVLDVLGKLLDKDHKRFDCPFALHRMTTCWDERLGGFLLNFAKSRNLKPKFFGELLEEMIQRNSHGAAAYAMSLLVLPVPVMCGPRLRMHAAAQALLAHSLAASWARLWPIMQEAPDFGREIFLSAARNVDRMVRRSDKWGRDLAAENAGDLYIWLEYEFPKWEDPQRTSMGPHEVTPRDNIADLRDGVLWELASRGAPEALAAVERIREEFPEQDWTWYILRAKEALTEGTWAPRSPREVINLRPAATRHLEIALGDLDMEATVTGPADVIVICAVPNLELDKVRKAAAQPWTELEPTSLDPQTYYFTTYTTIKGTSLRVVAAAPNQMGMPASAVLATKMIIRFRPKLVAMVGIAAGVKKEGVHGFGDILAAEHTFDYGSGKVTLTGEAGSKAITFQPDAKPLEIDTRLLQRLRHWQAARTAVLDEIRRKWNAEPPNTVLRLHIGPLASGAAVIDAKSSVDEVAERWRKLVGMEMEAYAVHRACKDTIEPPRMFLCLKSISDFAQDKEDTWRPYAAFTAAELCHRFILEEWEGLFPK